MNHSIFAATIFSVVCCLSPSLAAEEEEGFRFLATGDLPYTPEQDLPFRRLLKQSEREDFAFLMHVGDIKAQSMPCSDETFGKIRDLFRTYPKPVVYTPGDNEWTDCHGTGSDPIERLGKLRELFFHETSTLRLSQLQTVHQSRHTQFSQYVENYRFQKSGVMFIVTHVVGSGNNMRTADADAMQEFEQRNTANTAFLNESFAAAQASDASGVALVIHANPDFEKGEDPGFTDFLATVRAFLQEYRRPVICIHGDTHYYRIDQPFRRATGKLWLNFTRMEVFGSPNVAGVAVTVDPADPLLFQFRPYYLEQ